MAAIDEVGVKTIEYPMRLLMSGSVRSSQSLSCDGNLGVRNSSETSSEHA